MITTLAGPKILLEGPSGTGKTYALGTLAEWAQANGRETFIIFTENGLETLVKYFHDRGKDIPPSLHWHVIRTPVLGLDKLISASVDTGKMSYELLTKTIDPNRGRDNPWEKFLRTLVDVPCDRTGKTYGNVGEWDNTKILVNDSLSETAIACFKMVLGTKLTAAQHEYMVAQNNLINWLRFMTQSLQCTFVITAHVQRLVDELGQTSKIMTKTMIGKAIGDDIPQLFSEALYCVREGDKFWWDTAALGVDTKTRYLPIRSKIPPDFGQIMGKWLEMQK